MCRIILLTILIVLSWSVAGCGPVETTVTEPDGPIAPPPKSDSSGSDGPVKLEKSSAPIRSLK